MDLFGSYFPAWMLCAAAGIVATVIIRLILAVFRYQRLRRRSAADLRRPRGVCYVACLADLVRSLRDGAAPQGAWHPGQPRRAGRRPGDRGARNRAGSTNGRVPTTPICRPTSSTWRRMSAAGSSSSTCATTRQCTRATCCSGSTRSLTDCAWARRARRYSVLEAKVALTAHQVAAQTSGAGAAARGIGSAEAQRGARFEHVGAVRASARARLCYRTAGRPGAHRAAHRANCAATGAAAGGRGAPGHHQHQAHRGGAGRRARHARSRRARPEQDGGAAPCDGRITALDIAAGEFAAVGVPLFTIITPTLVCDRQFSRDRPRGNEAGAAGDSLRDGATRPSAARRGRQPRLGRGVGCERHGSAASRMSSARSTGCGSPPAFRCASCSTRRPTT